jgi:tetratricopeptide (TPR) repeat protein
MLLLRNRTGAARYNPICVRLAAVVLSLPLGLVLLWAGEPQDPLREAQTALHSGDVGAAIRLYREFLTRYPNAAEIRSNLGAALVQDGQFAAAVTEYTSALRQMPNNLRVRMNLALAYYKLGRLPEAVEHLEALHKLQPLELKPALLLADCMLETNLPAKAVEVLTPLHEEYPDDHAVVYALGMALMKDNRIPEAQALLDRILRDGESAEAAFLLGQSELLRNDLAAAAGHLARAVELDPKMPWVHTLYGQALKAAGKVDEATVQFNEELKVNPYDFTANTETALQFLQDGKPDEALTHIAMALQVRPNDPGALYQRASIHLTQGLIEQARQELEQLIRDHPSFSEAHAALARVYYKLQRTADGDREAAEARRVREEAQKQMEEKRNSPAAKKE